MKLSHTTWLIGTSLTFATSCLNPFAPHLHTSAAVTTCDPTIIEGVFQCFQKAYSSRDTTLYGDLLDASFIFVYRDYEQGLDVSWGRDEELRTTYGLFQTAQRLDLIWNNTVSTSSDSTTFNIVRGFNLTIIFNPNDIERIDGYANLTLEHPLNAGSWKITRWRDESNY